MIPIKFSVNITISALEKIMYFYQRLNNIILKLKLK